MELKGWNGGCQGLGGGGRGKEVSLINGQKILGKEDE